MKNFKFSSSANGKVFRNGLYSTAILAAAIVLAVLINLLVGAIPKKYTEFDLSAAKMYTLGDSSRQLMQSLDQDVTVYYLCETGSEDAIITKLLDHYADESGHFHWEQKDPTLYPTFAARYGAENASTGSLIVVSGENSEVLNAAELYEYDYSDYYTTGAANVSRNSLLPIICVFWFQMRNTLRLVAHSGSEPPTIQRFLLTMWVILSIWMTGPIRSQSCGMTRCSCCPPA